MKKLTTFLFICIHKIGIANFEAFGKNILLSTKLLALKSPSIRLEEDSKIVKELLFF